MRLNNIFATILILFPYLGWAQSASPMSSTGEAEGYYQFPVRTGSQNYLSGTMGELRSNHFHAGIDIKTQGTQGLEVYATADGHISRIKVATGGYGHALYILHPNGTTSVYAHLQRYNTEIADYVRKAQYQKKSFEIELFPEKNQFQVKKGEVIGYSGNTGSSGGPHLHFEIRDSQQRPLNPLKYKFPEIRDNIRPEVRKIALRTMGQHSRINGQYGRFEFIVLRNGANYSLPGSITAFGNIGVEILTYDKLNGANNRNGVPCMELSLDGEQVFQQNLQRFRFSETRSILIHTDYQTAQETSQRFVKMYVDNGNTLPFYETNGSGGILRINKGTEHQVQINLWDIYNNHSQVEFAIKGSEPVAKLELSNYSDASKISYELLGNNLLIKASVNQDNSCAQVYSNRMRYQLEPSYQANQTMLFLWDMDQGLPDSLSYDQQTVVFHYKALMPGTSAFNYYSDLLEIHIPSQALFDTVFLTYSYALDSASYREEFTVCKDIFPIRKNITITLKPKLKYEDTDKTAVYTLEERGNPSYAGGQWDGNKIAFQTRNWGSYTILTDSIKPEIRPLILNQDQLVFRIKDTLSGIDEYQLELDGKWVLMKYDYKKDLIRSEKLDQSIPFKGALNLKVTDHAGNVKNYHTKIS